MIRIKPTEHLTGVMVEGDRNDFEDLVESIYNLTFFNDEFDDFYFGVKNRLLGACYDIRHAGMGDREIFLEHNGMTKEKMKWHGIRVPEQTVYYRTNLLFPEVIFLACAVPSIYLFSSINYGKETSHKGPKIDKPPVTQFLRDQSNLNVFCSAVWQALGMAVGAEEADELNRLWQRSDKDYQHYVTHYVDKYNLELIKTPTEKRVRKLINITRRFIRKPEGYFGMESDVKYWAEERKTNMYELEFPELAYPGELTW